MIEKSELQAWLDTLSEDADVAIDDGGLTIVEIGDDGEPTEAYLEIGGIPLEDEEE